jgi:hypothetical protein
MHLAPIARLLVLLGTGLAAGAANAGTTVTTTTTTATTTSPTTSRVVVSAESCRRLTKHVPSADVEYKPGEDGVVPADLDGASAVSVPKNFDIPIQIDTLSRLGLTGTAGLEADAAIGTVQIRDGLAYFNDQPLGAQDQRQVVYACEKALTR